MTHVPTEPRIPVRARAGISEVFWTAFAAGIGCGLVIAGVAMLFAVVLIK